MIASIEQNEGMIRLFVFGGVLALMLLLETLFPRKERTQNRAKHIANNLGIVVFYTLVMRVVFPIAAMGTAVFAASKGWGILNLLDFPIWAHIVISAILLDMAVYWQHVASHKFPMIWSFHKMHHADRDIDATTGIRFHPVEIILSMLYKMVIVLILGPHVIGVFLFEVLLNGSAMFNHANIRLPLWLDKTVRILFVTPDMHRVHHSVIVCETNSNYGFNLSIWDKIFGSYIDQPKEGHDGMTIGLPEYQTDEPSNILWCLKLPFTK
ncbi:MAG: sterol desaturase family protein [Robiginitomaculum sp.]|nr:sterol desaturase family protein [Robiginitomaculum sp.]